MPTECIPDLFGFARVEGRSVVAAFDGGAVTSDAGALLLGASDRALGLVRRFASCFRDARCAALIAPTRRRSACATKSRCAKRPHRAAFATRRTCRASLRKYSA
jgi:Transposase DDE domain group 1